MKNTIRATFVILSLASALLAGCDVGPDEATTDDETTEVTEALVNTGAGSLSWSCSEDGSCYCSGGTLSSDCWGLAPYCIDRFECRVSAPYLCYCHWKAVKQAPPVVKGTLGTGTVAKAISR